jgi:hypothetical protein
MLEKLLAEIQNGGTLRPAALAAKLKISAALVEMMLEDLERRELLAQVTTNCNEPCGGCPLVGDCAIQNPQGRLWMLAHKKGILERIHQTLEVGRLASPEGVSQRRPRRPGSRAG